MFFFLFHDLPAWNKQTEILPLASALITHLRCQFNHAFAPLLIFMPRFKSIIFWLNRPKIKFVLQKNCKISEKKIFNKNRPILEKRKQISNQIPDIWRGTRTRAHVGHLLEKVELSLDLAIIYSEFFTRLIVLKTVTCPILNSKVHFGKLKILKSQTNFLILSDFNLMQCFNSWRGTVSVLPQCLNKKQV